MFFNKKQISVTFKAIFLIFGVFAGYSATNHGKLSGFRFISPAYAEDDLAKGLKYYELGQIDKAFKVMIPLADKGVLGAIPTLLIMYANDVPPPPGPNLNIYKNGSDGKINNSIASVNAAITKINELSDKYLPLIKAKAESGDVIDLYNYGNALFTTQFIKLGNEIANTEPRPIVANDFVQKISSDANFAAQVKESERLITLAANKKYAEAEFLLAMFYVKTQENFDSDKINYIRALLSDAAKQGHSGAQLELFNFEIINVDFDATPFETNFHYVELSADQGNLKALSVLAEYNQGTYPSYPTKDAKKVLQIYQKMVELGAVTADYSIAEIYLKGELVPFNLQTALKYYKKAALAGSVQAQYQIGLLNLDDKYIRTNYREARKWLEMAAKVDFQPAIIVLSKIYLSGILGDDKTEEGLKWLERAAELKNIQAYFNLATLYDVPNTKIYDEQKALKYYKLASEFGLADAQSEFAKFLANRADDKNNKIEALMWLYVALSGNFEDAENKKLAEKSQNTLEAKLPEDDKKLASRLAVKCINLNFKGCGIQSIK